MEAPYLITGAAGMLGRRALADAPPGVRAVGVERADGDLADRRTVDRLFRTLGPLRGVLHAAGHTDVDGAEAEPDRARRDNVETTRHLAAACAAEGIALLLVSSDYVFDGRSTRPYREQDPPGPLNTYGTTKLEAERVALALHPKGTLIVRTAWLYGPGFPDRILALAEQRETLDVVDDQRGSPTSTAELVPALWDLLASGASGLYHAACEGVASWFDVAAACLGEGRVRRCTTDAFPRPARRPAMSALDSGRLAALRGRPLRHWREALLRYLTERT